MGEERWPEQAPPTWRETAAVTARMAGFASTGSSSSMGNPSESAMSASVSVSRCHSFAGVRVKFSDQHVSPHIWLRLIQLILLLQDWSPV